MPKSRDSKDRVDIRGEIRGQSIELGNHAFMDCIGPDAVLIDCEIKLAGAGIIAAGGRFQRCKIFGKRPRQLRLDGWEFEDCVFVGRFWGVVIGEDEGAGHAVSHCDFSQANLHMTRLHRCVAQDQVWPGWPQVAVFGLQEHLADWLQLALPLPLPTLQDMLAVTARTYGKDTVHVFDLSKLVSADDLDAARRALAGRPFIR